MLVCGIDSGARATKVVLLDDAAGVVASAELPTGASPARASAEALSRALAAAGESRKAISVVTATGYGRSGIDADARLTEITCHARGAAAFLPGVRLVVDVGGQDSKFIALDPSGEVEDFAMNDRCAAGTGRFLEVMSAILGVDVAALSDLASKAANPAPISSLCVVFTESEVVSLIARGARPADIAAGVLKAMAVRMRSVMGHVVPREPAVFVGGVARNASFAAALGAQVGVGFRVPPDPHLNGAYGAALFSLENAAQ